MTETRYWEEPNLRLRSLHLNGYRWATAAELRSERERRAPRANVIRDRDEPFLITDLLGPTERGDDANDGDMWQAFLEADGRDGLLKFAETWGMPAAFGLVRTSRSLAVPWPTLKRAREAFRTAARLLTAREEDALDDVVRFDRSRPMWEVLVWIEGWGFDWSLVPPSLVEAANAGSGDPGDLSRRIAQSIASDALSGLIYGHTRNMLVAGAGLARPEVRRFSDPIGGMALYMASQLEAGKHLRRCELDTCRRLFYTEGRSDQRFCSMSHKNSASNKRSRQRAKNAGTR